VTKALVRGRDAVLGTHTRDRAQLRRGDPDGASLSAVAPATRYASYSLRWPRYWTMPR
jgi:hypothetical protein